MGLSEEIRQQLINSFKTEQSEHVQKINQGLLALEKKPAATERQTWLNDIFREAHSLKGAARAVGMTTIESLGHSLEDVLLNAKEGRLTFSPELFDLLYQALDAIELLVERIEAGLSNPPAKVLALLTQLEEVSAGVGKEQDSQQAAQDSPDAISSEIDTDEAAPSPLELSANLVPPKLTPSGEQASKIQNQKVDETIRVSVSKLDALMTQSSELLGAKIRAEQRLIEVREIQTSMAEWQKEWTTLRTHYSRLLRNNDGAGHNGSSKDVVALLDFASYNQEKLHTLNIQSNSLYRQLSNDTMRLSLMIDELQEEIKRARMLPLSTITTTFDRMIRDLARDGNKQIDLTLIGRETELDKRVLEQIKAPLMHLLRNAVDHGLETTAERQQAGKPEVGQIILSATQQASNVIITVRDDGRGLDLEAIRQAAVRKGLLDTTTAKKLSHTEVANLIFNSGLSTSKIITDISGRGVGLDVVRQNVEELQGTLEVSFETGQSTTFTMILPLTLASSRGLLVQVGQQHFALPLTTVNRLLQIEQSQITKAEGKEAISYKNQPVAVVWLADLLELPRNNKSGRLTVIIVGVAEKRLGLIVDGLAGEQEIVMKGLGKQLTKIGGIAGATVLGSGQVILVLHTADLIKLAARTPLHQRVINDIASTNDVDRPKTILVVDDSITTRTLEKNILEAAGYNVKVATNGMEALGLLVSNNLPNLVVSDVNMPRLDGFGLTRRIKQDSRYADLPVILVTSLDTPADKAQGIEVGADAYIVKGNFDQSTLLETVEQLIG